MIQTRPVISFSKRESAMPMPHLLDIQTRAFSALLNPDDIEGDRQDVSLERVFRDLFPITDVNGKYELDFKSYSLGEPKYSVEECIERDMTYAAPLKAKLALNVFEDVDGQRRLKNQIEREVYLGELPIMTPLGTFVINGAERVVVSQLHRSPGVVFEEETHPNGQLLYSARIIPFRGSWVEFTIDIHDVIYVHIDKKKKFPATALLRAFGYGNNADILKLFFATKTISIAGKLEARQERREVVGALLAADVPDPENPGGDPLGRLGDELTPDRLNAMRHVGVKEVVVFAGYTSLDLREDEQPTTTRDRHVPQLAFDAADPATGEVVAEAGAELTDKLRKKFLDAGISRVDVLLPPGRSESPLIKNTLAKDPTKDETEALQQIYSLLRPGDAPNLETARAQLQRLFFNPKRYDLGRVGRYKINHRLGLKTDMNHTVLTEDDFIAIVRYLIDLHDDRGHTDDIDHLGNRRIRSVGELIANQFSVGLSRMARLVKERMSINSDPEKISLDDLVNARTVSAVIQAFFGSSQLSQFMDQTNPLAELTNKRRLSALGPGGLTRERAGFEVRDVHYSQYGRMCPIETPEGPNIGLITSLATFARINELGFIETPYRVVKDGRVTDEYRWLSASEEEGYAVAQANTAVDKDGKFTESMVLCRRGDDYPLLTPSRIDFMDVSPEQLVSIAAALIPFLEHDDANRALMGSNMQRQAVPLLFPDAPTVGTGLEAKVASDSGAVISARRAGVVTRVTADEIIVDCGTDGATDVPLARLAQVDRYRVKKFWRTNQDTAINQRPLVQVGDQVGQGQVIADGPGTEHGELALGGNVTVAFMPWYGHNFEDAIILSERLVKDDVYSSIHIQELELHVRDTKRGQEEITREIPNVSDEALVDLDERGIIRIGAHVKPGDILVGKITPKGETELSPEEKLLTAIFGEKAKDVKDSSLKVPPGMKGTVIDVKIFSRVEDQVVEKDRGERIGEVRRIEHEEKSRINDVMVSELKELLAGQDVALMLKAGTVEEFLPAGTKLTAAGLADIDLHDVDLKTLRLANKGANERVRLTIDSAARERAKVEEKAEDQIDKILQPDELPPGVIQLVKVYLGEKRKISVGDKMAGRHGNKGIVARIVPEEDMPFLPDGSPVDIVLNPLGVPSRMNVGQILETHLGWCARILGFKAKTPVFRGADEGEIGLLLRLAGLHWAGESLNLKVKGPAPSVEVVRTLATDLSRLNLAKKNLAEAGIAELMHDGVSASTRKLGDEVKAFLAAAATELAGREQANRAHEVAAHRAALEGAEGARKKELEAAIKGLEGKGSGEAELLTDAGLPELAAIVGGKATAETIGAAADAVIRRAGLTPGGKVRLRDGRTGQSFESDVTVGTIYMLKLSHLVDDKIHARSIGPYSLVTQQPLAGKAQFGGQRFGEMEVWALEAYGAAHLLQEMLTVKSDDVNGRSKVYESIVKGQNLPEPGIPESFNVLVKELQALGLKVTLGATAEGEE
ncbi:MAG: DNA-directed RNA polymerase subunit beta [Gemmatimonadales bacterium]